MRKVAHLYPLIIAVAASAQPRTAAAIPPGSLLTLDQERVDKRAIVLLDDPVVESVVDEGMRRWSALQQDIGRDATNTLMGAVEEGEFSALRAVAAYDPDTPRVFWECAPAYAYGSFRVPGSRHSADSPDYVFRAFAVDPSHRYQIRGQQLRPAVPDDFTFEVLPTITPVGSSPVAVLGADDVDVGADGTFTVTLDSSSASGRRNHLTLPENAKVILIRDRLADWKTQLPNQLTVKRIDTVPVPTRTLGEIRRQAADAVAHWFELNLAAVERISKEPVNYPKGQLEAGNAGAVVAMSRFRIELDEVLMISINPVGARYVGVEVTDPWLRSRPYWATAGSLSNSQAKPSRDGSLTYLIAAVDPGYSNWLDTGSLREGVLVVRAESFVRPPDPAKLIREARVVKLTRLAAVMSRDSVRVTAQERTQQNSARYSAYLRRVAH